jgi:spermidine/putrescine transport system ATP-binding protein
MAELRGVTKQFGAVTAVENIDLQIRAGEFMTFLGPSGCGKTTLLRLLSGFENPTAGQIFLEGMDVTDLPPYRRDVNQVFQSYALFPHLDVRENIAFGLQMKKTPAPESARRVEEAIDMVALGGLEERRPSQLSGGQRQRVALARAIVCRPKVLLLDEPLSALDAKLRRAMQAELKRLQHKIGITFIFVTHDQEEALAMSDRVAVMHRGKIEQLGTPGDIYHRPHSSFVADFIGQANIFEGPIARRNATTALLSLNDRTFLEINAEELPPEARTAIVSIRPEKIMLHPAAPEGANVFEARVEEELFKGAATQLAIATASGLKLTAVLANETRTAVGFHPGDRVFCQIYPDAIVIVQGEKTFAEALPPR